MKYTIAVSRNAGVRREDLNELDADVVGVYTIADAANEAAALDQFHEMTPVKVLEDFHIEAISKPHREIKGLHCSVLRSDSRYECTNGGVTAHAESVTLTGDGVSGPFEPGDRSPELALVYDLDPKGAASGYLMVANVSWLRGLDLDHGPSGEFSCFGKDWSSRHKIVRVKAVPIVDGKPKGGMFGGNFISTSDSRFPMTAPIPVFDRFE